MFSPENLGFGVMNDWNYLIDYWGWILDLTEENMVWAERKWS